MTKAQTARALREADARDLRQRSLSAKSRAVAPLALRGMSALPQPHPHG